MTSSSPHQNWSSFSARKEETQAPCAQGDREWVWLVCGQSVTWPSRSPRTNFTVSYMWVASPPKGAALGPVQAATCRAVRE